MIKAIIFDCFGVLTADRWTEFGQTLPPAERESSRALNNQYDSGKITLSQFVEQVSKITGKDSNFIESLVDGSASYPKNQQLLDYIQILGHKFKIGLLSNVATGWVRESFLTPQEQELFDDLVLSYEVGLAKPDAKIFAVACQRLQVSPEETVFIDDIQRYCDAAEAIGMHAIHYSDFESMKKQLEALLTLHD